MSYCKILNIKIVKIIFDQKSDYAPLRRKNISMRNKNTYFYIIIYKHAILISNLKHSRLQWYPFFNVFRQNSLLTGRETSNPILALHNIWRATNYIWKLHFKLAFHLSILPKIIDDIHEKRHMWFILEFIFRTGKFLLFL